MMADDAPVDVGPWRRRSRRVAYENPWIDVWQDEVDRPDGSAGIYGLVHFHSRAVGVVAVGEDGRLLLVGQHRYALDEYSWEIPEGGVDASESLEEGARRELREETGYAADRWRQVARITLSNSVTDERGALFIADGLTAGVAEPDASEVLETRWATLDEVLAEIAAGEIHDLLTIAGRRACTRPSARGSTRHDRADGAARVRGTGRAWRQSRWAWSSTAPPSPRHAARRSRPRSGSRRRCSSTTPRPARSGSTRRPRSSRSRATRPSGRAGSCGGSGIGGDVLRPPAGEVVAWQEGELAWVRARPSWIHPIEVVQHADAAAVEALPVAAGPTGSRYAWAWIDEPAGVLRSRYFVPAFGIGEDEATGAAAVLMGGLLGRDLDIRQGVASQLLVHQGPDGTVEVGGRVEPVETRALAEPPEPTPA